MADINYVPYSVADNEDAIALESGCIQGESIALRFQRETFHRRSEVYENSQILCAKRSSELIGICAWAVKPLRYRDETIHAAYSYDLRVHPAYRGQGVAKGFVREASKILDNKMDCLYTLVSGENVRALSLVKRMYGTTQSLPLTYTIIPVYKRFRERKHFSISSAAEIHDLFLKENKEVDFLPELNGDRLIGFVTGIIGEDACAGCSIWTNETLLAEQVVSLSWKYRVQRACFEALRPLVKLPRIPKPLETIRSWFLFDLFARDADALHQLLRRVNNLALDHGRDFIYMLHQKGDPHLSLIYSAGLRVYKLPYFFLAKGRICPGKRDKIYIDIRDL
jgi:ribosomal protein S18 acetylase RimI-like enzyme